MNEIIEKKIKALAETLNKAFDLYSNARVLGRTETFHAIHHDAMGILTEIMESPELIKKHYKALKSVCDDIRASGFPSTDDECKNHANTWELFWVKMDEYGLVIVGGDVLTV